MLKRQQTAPLQRMTVAEPLLRLRLEVQSDHRDSVKEATARRELPAVKPQLPEISEMVVSRGLQRTTVSSANDGMSYLRAT